jgi:UDP-3-O-[3-hydroxymyristoyl] glucosamine N-acyltransferase
LQLKSFSVQEVVEWVGGRVANATALQSSDLEKIRIDSPSELGKSKANHIGFFFAKSYQNELMTAAPGILITADPFVGPLQASGLPLWKKSAIISCPDPYLAMALISKKLAPQLSAVAHIDEPIGKTEIHPSAIVDPSAELAEGVIVGAHCVIEEGVRIGAGTRLYPGCYIGKDSVIGRQCVLFPRVTLYELTSVGDRVRLHAGVVLGADGFGYAPRRQDGKVVGHEKIYHVGRVIVGNDVEIGANTCVDRGTMGDTVIRDMAKIDDQVMIGHNCRLDVGAVICGNAGLAGRAKIGKFTYIGGMAGVGNDTEIGDGAMVGALSVVAADVEPGVSMIGNPSRTVRDHNRIHVLLNRMLREKEKNDSSKRNRSS